MAGLEAIDPRYLGIWARAQQELATDSRVRSLELSGSVGAGTADRWSDLDLHLIAEPSAYDALLQDWPAWVAAITPTVFARTPIAPFIINAVTADGLTLDFAVFSGVVPPPPTPAGYQVGMLAGRQLPTMAGALEYAVAEQMRGLVGPFISLLQREEHVRHLTGIGHLVLLLNTVFLAETDSPPLQKHWNRSLTEEQRAAVAALTAVSHACDGILGFGLGLAQLLVDRARPLFPRYELTWPSDLAAVAATRLEDTLDVRVSDWLH